MKKFDLSVIIPSIRVQHLDRIYFMLEKAVEPYSFELIVVGPYDVSDSLKQTDNVKYIKDFGSPSRCVQLGSTLSEGTYLCWMSDDLTQIIPNSLAKCIKILEESHKKDVVTLRYFEGDGTGEFPLDYWRCHHHPDLRLKGIKENFLAAPLGMYNTDYFREIGGLDCRWLHINYCTHDLVYRAQQDGGKVHLSPTNIASFYWSWHSEESKPVQRAHYENDLPLFKEIWDQDQSGRISIDYWNWTQASSKWKMRFDS